MERLISLFREPAYDDWSPSQPEAARFAEREAEPLYFQQLLEYLREEREEREDADTLIGA